MRQHLTTTVSRFPKNGLLQLWAAITLFMFHHAVAGCIGAAGWCLFCSAATVLTGAAAAAAAPAAAVEATVCNCNGTNLTACAPKCATTDQEATTTALLNVGPGGSIPVDLGCLLPALTSLNLPDHQLTGVLPASLASMANLTSVVLDGNQLSGSLPWEWGTALAALEELSVSNNVLSHPIPASLGSLPALARLNLGNNSHINGSLPASLGSLHRSLTAFLVFSNSVTGSIPASLGSLTRLRSALVLYNNLISGTIPGGSDGGFCGVVAVVANSSNSTCNLGQNPFEYECECVGVRKHGMQVSVLNCCGGGSAAATAVSCLRSQLVFCLLFSCDNLRARFLLVIVGCPARRPTPPPFLNACACLSACLPPLCVCVRNVARVLAFVASQFAAARFLPVWNSPRAVWREVQRELIGEYRHGDSAGLLPCGGHRAPPKLPPQPTVLFEYVLRQHARRC